MMGELHQIAIVVIDSFIAPGAPEPGAGPEGLNDAKRYLSEDEGIEVEERAAILEFDAAHERDDAERRAVNEFCKARNRRRVKE